MNPYSYYDTIAYEGDGIVLDLMSGNGIALDYIADSSKFIFVEIYPPYLEVLKSKLPVNHTAKLVCMDSIEYLKSLPNKSIPCITCFDGIEHLTKTDGLELLKEIDRVCTRACLIFTPQGHAEHGGTFNAPKDTWGITGGDKYQEHLSGWTVDEMRQHGYILIEQTTGMPNYYDNTTYTENMYKKVYG